MKLKKKVSSINQFAVQVDYFDINSAKPAQEKILSLAKNKLAQILDEACEKYDNDNLVKIQKVTLDLGDIAINDIEKKLPDLFEKKIDKIFSGIKNEIFSTDEIDGIELIDVEKQILLYFTYYLKYGAIPWYFSNIFEDYSFDEVFAYLIESNQESFVKELFDVMEFNPVRIRLLKYFETGQIFNFFENNFSKTFYHDLQSVYTELNQLILNSRKIESIEKTYLRIFLKEFILIAAVNAKKLNRNYTLEELTKQYLDFTSKEKNISFEKWIPAIIIDFENIISKNPSNDLIISLMQKYYADFLIKKKFSVSDYKSEKITDKTQFYDWLLKKQPVTGRYLSKTIEGIISSLCKQFISLEKTNVEQIVLEATYDIIPDISISIENVSKWIYAITQQVSEIFGVSLKDVVTDIQTEIINEEVSIPPLIDENERYDGFDISVVRDYLSLFIKSGLTPFKKLYQHPEVVLKKIFKKYITEDSEAESFVKNIVQDDLILIWRIKEAFGDELLKEFERITSRKLDQSLDYLLLVNFIKTGGFPWPEIISIGYDNLVNKIKKFGKKEHRELLSKVLIGESFFYHHNIMEKVFDIMPVSFGKTLLGIRKDLADKSILDLKAITIKKQTAESGFDESKKGKLKPSESEHIKEESIVEESKISDDISLVDGLLNQIIEFKRRKISDKLIIKKQANFIFEEIVKSSRKALYETAAMLVSVDKKTLDSLMQVFDTNQKDFIKKLVKNYRSRFVSIAEEIKESEKDEDRKQFLSDQETGETFYIKNAGLVLLNVYFKRLFNRLDLLDKNEFKSDETRERAIYILQYLATKNDNPKEHELALNKILVGMPLSMPLKFKIVLTDEEKEICDGLLDAAIKNWTVLKNTSIDGFRGSFLLRNGSIKKEDAAWQLHVEKKAYDILLGKLPWGYTMIHFPWMDIPMLTVWEDQ